jgi:hypothetical protein
VNGGGALSGLLSQITTLLNQILALLELEGVTCGRGHLNGRGHTR